MKKILVLFLALLLMLPTIASAEIPGFWTPPTINDGQYPFGDGSAALEYWMPINAGASNFISSYDENPAVVKWQEDTGIDVAFIHPTVGMEKEQFNLLMSSGELPDIILIPNTSYYNGGIKKMYTDGAIIDIAPYLEQYAPQYLACVNQSEISKKQVINGDNGEIFGFYRISHKDAEPYHRMNLRADWLEEFQMTEPKTIAEYEAYFDKILATKPGVTPLYVDFTNSGTLNLLIGAFDILPDFYVKEGVVGHSANSLEYKEFLKLMNEWYSKGYITKDVVSLTGTEVDAMFDNGQLGMYANSVDVIYARTKNLPIKATNAPYMRKEADSLLHNQIPNTPVDMGLPCVSMITSACDNVEAAVAFLNYAYTYEGGLVANWGIEGSTWNWGEDGLPKFTDYYTHNPNGMTTSNVAYALRCHLFSKYTYSDNICGLVDEAQVANRTKWVGDNTDDALRLPPVNLSSDELSQRTDLMNNTSTYIEEMKLKFITGTESFDNWDQYIQTVNTMGLAKAISIMQSAYDRY